MQRTITNQLINSSMIKSMHNKEIAIKLTGINKKYEIHHEKPTLVEKFVKGKNETFWALKNINLTIYKGEHVGIIGSNGSGKTSLLKIISGISTPSSGTAVIKGSLVSLIDIEAGFHPDLSGLQNIYLNGMIVGMSKRTIDAQLSEIISFANIHQFIDAPLFTYSDGMKLRLGFSIAVHTNPDILILDEVITGGDIDFRQKIDTKLSQLFTKNLTVLFVSHWLEYIKKRSKRVLWFDKGKLREDGNHNIIQLYQRMIRNNTYKTLHTHET